MKKPDTEKRCRKCRHPELIGAGNNHETMWCREHKKEVQRYEGTDCDEFCERFDFNVRPDKINPFILTKTGKMPKEYYPYIDK